jgi:transposase
MAQTVNVIVGETDRKRLAAIASDRARPLKHVQRAHIILYSAERRSVLEVAELAGVSRPAVWRWQVRYAELGVDGLLRDKTRPPGRAPHPTAKVAEVLALTCSDPPGEVTHWTGRAVAKAVGISLRAVQRIWDQHRLQPHRLRTFKRSKDPAFAAKVEDIVGLYMSPPHHAVVLSIDEKSQIQALDRTQPGLPLKPGKCATMTHDYKRNGTTTLFAALNVLDGVVLGRCMQQHRHQEFIRFLNAVEHDVPAGKVIHAVLDNYGTHKHPKVLAWLARHPRWTLIIFQPKPKIALDQIKAAKAQGVAPGVILADAGYGAVSRRPDATRLGLCGGRAADTQCLASRRRPATAQAVERQGPAYDTHAPRRRSPAGFGQGPGRSDSAAGPANGGLARGIQRRTRLPLRRHAAAAGV